MKFENQVQMQFKKSLWKELFLNSGYLMDPHTAVGQYVAKHFGSPSIPTVISGTAHYGKFVDNILPVLSKKGEWMIDGWDIAHSHSLLSHML